MHKKQGTLGTQCPPPSQGTQHKPGDVIPPEWQHDDISLDPITSQDF